MGIITAYDSAFLLNIIPVSTSLQQCFDFAATMNTEARRDIYILLEGGAVINAPEIEEFLATQGSDR